MVCDCETEEKTACAEPAKVVETPVAQAAGPPPIEKPTPEVKPDIEPTPVVTQSSPGADLAVINIAVDAAKVEPASVKRQFGSVVSSAFKGEFSAKSGSEYVGVDSSKVYFRNGGWRTNESFDSLAAAGDLEALDVSPFAAEFVRDGFLELAVYTVDTSDPAQRVYRFRIYKAIGSRIGVIFDHPVAVKTADGIRQLAKVEVVEGSPHPQIRAIPYSADGLLDLNRTRVYSWNKWEGMFRVPKKAPTAP